MSDDRNIQSTVRPSFEPCINVTTAVTETTLQPQH